MFFVFLGKNISISFFANLHILLYAFPESHKSGIIHLCTFVEYRVYISQLYLFDLATIHELDEEFFWEIFYRTIYLMSLIIIP